MERLAALPQPAAVPSQTTCDVLVVGGGVAGLTVALSLPPTLRVTLVTKGALGESNTRYAQGGLAAAVGADDDPALHLRDTLAAGAGLSDATAASVLVEEAAEAVRWLVATGAAFDQRPAPSAGPLPVYDLAQEAAHSRRRVLHARDATGAEIERALVDAVRARPGVQVLESTTVLDLTVEQGACVGATLHCAGARWAIRADAVVLANGGAGQLWLRTSNPAGATGDGLALAWRAGAALADLEFMQFHPTTLVPPGAGAPFLISEAVRGEGAYVRNAAGERFLPRYTPEAELAPRDVVARSILSEMLATGSDCAYLDLRHLPADLVHSRFPTLVAACQAQGLRLAHDLIPVAPAAHYYMGGIATDTWARTTLPGLFAVGEVACTGVHGANRLASNSLLEGLVFGRRLARLLHGAEQPGPWPTRSPLPGTSVAHAAPLLPAVSPEATPAEEARQALRHLLWRHAALRRDAAGLRAAEAGLRTLAAARAYDAETANMLLVAQLAVAAALAREESRGAHYRLDFPSAVDALAGQHSLLLPGVAAAATLREEVGTHARYA